MARWDGPERIDGCHTPSPPGTPLVSTEEIFPRKPGHRPENAALFDAAVLRPPNVYGYSSSYYGVIFGWAGEVRAAQEGAEGRPVTRSPSTRAPSSPRCTSTTAPRRTSRSRNSPTGRGSRVAGQTFNIGARRYETTAALLEALAREYGIRGGFRFTDTERARKNIDGVMSSVLGWSQWLGSDKIRMVTGWTEKRMLFAENLSVYRKAYEYAVKTEHDDVARVPEMKRFFRKGFEE